MIFLFFVPWVRALFADPFVPTLPGVAAGPTSGACPRSSDLYRANPRGEFFVPFPGSASLPFRRVLAAGKLAERPQPAV